jgi:hypothetical protein
MFALYVVLGTAGALTVVLLCCVGGEVQSFSVAIARYDELQIGCSDS